MRVNGGWRAVGQTDKAGGEMFNGVMGFNDGRLFQKVSQGFPGGRE